MSKRAGEFVTLDELVEEIGVDAARWFLLNRSHDTTIEVDLELATSETSENPVYYVQYAHARIAAVLRKAGDERVADALAEGFPAVRAGAAPERARADREAAGLAGRDGRGRRAPRRPPHRLLRAGAVAGVLGLLPRLPGRRRRARRAGVVPHRAERRHAADDRPRAGPARRQRAGRDVVPRLHAVSGAAVARPVVSAATRPPLRALACTGRRRSQHHWRLPVSAALRYTRYRGAAVARPVVSAATRPPLRALGVPGVVGRNTTRRLPVSAGARNSGRSTAPTKM